LPFEVAALAPGGEVLFADGEAVEGVFEDGEDFGLGVEPVEQGRAGFAVLQAEVELFAEVVGEGGDFAVAGAVGVRDRLEWIGDVLGGGRGLGLGRDRSFVASVDFIFVHIIILSGGEFSRLWSRRKTYGRIKEKV